MGNCLAKNEHKDTDLEQRAKIENLSDFDSFFIPTTISSLSRNLSEEIWNEYKD